MYRNNTGSLIHVANCSRPDIAFAVSVLCQKNQDPTAKDWTNIKHLMKYLKKTEDLAIKYTRTNSQLTTYVDADWACDKEERRSTTGYVISLAGGPISWKSKKQSLTAQCSNDAESIALSEVSREVLHFQGLLRELNLSEYVQSPCIIRMDNTGAISEASKPNQEERLRSRSISTSSIIL